MNVKSTDVVGRFYIHGKLKTLFKMSVHTPIGRKALGVIGGDEIISK